MSAASLRETRRTRIAGIPAPMWGAGIRIWLAMMLALYVAFWLQLEGAYSAAVCVGIVSQQTRGAAASKAFWRIVGTVVGVTASILIAGVFNGERWPFYIAVALWIGACTALSTLLDGHRAYGVVLSGYTVAIVGVANVDNPTDVFSAGVNRGAAILIGILAVLVVNDLFRTPEVFPDLRRKLSTLQRDVLAHVRSLHSGSPPDPVETAALARRITALHPTIDALASEYPFGDRRSRAARVAVDAMLALLGDASRMDVDTDGARDAFAAGSRTLERALRDLDGRPEGTRGPHQPAYRSRRNALWFGLRVFVGVLLSVWILALCGWPQTSQVIVLIASTLGISATSPNPVAFGKSLPISIICAAIVAGITQFIVLDGSDAFPMLMVAMAPPVIAGGMLAASGRPALAGLGTLANVFLPILMSLNNPQSYNPLTFLTVNLLAILASMGVFVILTTLFPVGPERRLDWMLRSARDDLRRASRGRLKGRAAAGWRHRDADRLGQAGSLVEQGHGRAGDLAELVRISDLTATALQLIAALAGRASKSPGAGLARRGLRDGDPRELGRAAEALSAILPEASALAGRAARLSGHDARRPSNAGGCRS